MATGAKCPRPPTPDLARHPVLSAVVDRWELVDALRTLAAAAGRAGYAEASGANPVEFDREADAAHDAVLALFDKLVRP